LAIHTSPLFKDFRGSVNRQLLFRQVGGKTVVSRFPDRSRVIYSEQQRQAQKRFSDAVSFARVVIKEPGLRDIYTIKASLLGFRSAWNAAIAEFMSDKPLEVKRKKIRFKKSDLNMAWNVRLNLFKYAEEQSKDILIPPKRIRSKPRRHTLHPISVCYRSSVSKIHLLSGTCY
jgi:hypothetical protein